MQTIVEKINFQLPNFPDEAKVWIYQADRQLTQEEEEKLKDLGNVFVEQWSSHGAKLHSAFLIIFGRFLVFVVDENSAGASGCSIDKSVHFIKKMEEEFQLQMFDRTKLAFLDQNSVINVLSIHELGNLKAFPFNGGKTLVFNNLIANFGQLKREWLVPVEATWINRTL